MRKIVACLIPLALLSALAPSVFAKDNLPHLQAALNVDHPDATEELARTLNFTFSLTNHGAQAIDPVPVLEASRLLINEREIKEWRPDITHLKYGGFGTGQKHSPLIEPGQSKDFQMKLGEYMTRPGTYSIVWRGEGFSALPTSVRVLPFSQKPPSIVALVQQIRAQLPSGWKTYVEPSTQWGGEYPDTYLRIVRDAPVHLYQRAMPNDNPANRKDDNSKGQFFIEFVVEPYLSPQEYLAHKAKNLETRKQLEVLYKSMRDINHKFDSFLPKNPEEKQRVERYAQLKESLYKLPEFHFQDIALSWFDPMTFRLGTIYGVESAYKLILDENARRESYDVTQRILAQLTRYEQIEEVLYDDGKEHQ